MIYLAGPIFGCTDDQAVTWRDLAKAAFGPGNCLDPLRRDYRGREDENTAAIVEGDKADIQGSDVVLANCWQPSYGTAMEIYFAWSLGIPVIAVVQPGRVSPWLRYHARICTSLDEAIRVTRELYAG